MANGVLKKWGQSIRSFFNKLLSTDLQRSIGLSLFIIGITTSIALITLSSMYDMSERLYKPLEDANNIRIQYISRDSNTRSATLPPKKASFLRMQYQVLEKFKYHHKEVGRVYYANYYSFTVILSLSLVITAMLAFVIAHKGWQTAPNLVKVSFGTFFCISSFMGVMTLTLGQKQNYEDNFKQYLYYDKIQNNIITFVNTSDQYDSVRAARVVDSFIVAVNSDLRDNNQFFLTIDANKASLDDISSKLGKSMNGK
jgi:hypothetical protein